MIHIAKKQQERQTLILKMKKKPQTPILDV